MMRAETETGESEGVGLAAPTIRPFVLLGLMIVAFFALSALTLLLPHDPYYRYQQLRSTVQFQTVWAYERIAFDRTPIEIAFIGNSRVASGVSAPKLQKHLSQDLGRTPNVANLAIPQEGRDAHYLLAVQLLKQHPETRLLVLSAIEQMPRTGHVAFKSMAEVSDVLEAPVFFNTAYFSNLAFIPYRQLSLFARSLAPDLFGLTKFDESAYWGTDHDTTLTFTTPTGKVVDRDRIVPADELRGPARARIASITPPLLPRSMAEREFAIEYYYTRQIAELARRNGTRVAFLYLPVFEHHAPLEQEAFYKQYGPVLDATFLASRAEMFSDYGHVNQNGTRLVTGWLADELVERGLVSR